MTSLSECRDFLICLSRDWRCVRIVRPSCDGVITLIRDGADSACHVTPDRRDDCVVRL